MRYCSKMKLKCQHLYFIINKYKYSMYSRQITNQIVNFTVTNNNVDKYKLI